MPSGDAAKDGVRKWLFQVLLRLVGIIPKGIITRLARVSVVRRTYLYFSPDEVLLEFEGHKIYIRPRDGMLDQVLLIHKNYLEGEVRVFHQLIKKGMTVLDIGANIGYYTLLAAKLVGPEGKVFAFEPEPRNFSLLKRNVELNDYENVTLVNKAVSNQSGVEQLYLSSGSLAHSLSSFKRKAGSVSVSITSLDEFLPEDVVIDFIKMDIEGAEEKALRGMKRILSKENVKAMIIEFHFKELESQGSSFREISDKLTAFGFQFYEMRRDATRGVDFQEALYLADKQGGGCNLLCLRK